jgi:hypothetical protein
VGGLKDFFLFLGVSHSLGHNQSRFWVCGVSCREAWMCVRPSYLFISILSIRFNKGFWVKLPLLICLLYSVILIFVII